MSESGVEAEGGLVVEPPRRRRSVEERLRVVEETLEPGASVARVARKYGIKREPGVSVAAATPGRPAWWRAERRGEAPTSGGEGGGGVGHAR